MKRADRLFSISLGVLFFIFCGESTAWSQVDQIEDFIRAGQSDAEALTKAYLKPIPSGIGGNLNTGWFTSASTHKTIGFDIQVRGALAFIPSPDQQFDLNDLNLKKLSPASSAATVSPTVGGNDSAGPEVVVKDQGEEVARFNLPQGSGLNIVPAPIIQASVGLIKNTDIIIRFIPKINIRDYGNLTVRGLGIKHSLSQWIPGSEFFPLNISIMLGFNRVDLTANLNLEPQQPDPTTEYDNQKIETIFNTFTAKFVVGKTLPFVSLYGAAGYETSNMDLRVTGNFPVQVTGPGGFEMTETLTDPFSYTQNGDNRFSLTGGLRFELFFFHLFGEYTLSKYSTVNAGVGFSFR